MAGDLKKQPFSEIWNGPKFRDLRDTDKLEGKCGCCEFRTSAWAAAPALTPWTAKMHGRIAIRVYQPKAMATKE